MKFVLITLTLLVLLMSCAKEGSPVEVGQGKADFGVVLLFEKDGVRMYRFYDNGHFLYFTIGNGKFQPQEETSKNSVWTNGASQ